MGPQVRRSRWRGWEPLTREHPPQRTALETGTAHWTPWRSSRRRYARPRPVLPKLTRNGSRSPRYTTGSPSSAPTSPASPTSTRARSTAPTTPSRARTPRCSTTSASRPAGSARVSSSAYRRSTQSPQHARRMPACSRTRSVAPAPVPVPVLVVLRSRCTCRLQTAHAFSFGFVAIIDKSGPLEICRGPPKLPDGRTRLPCEV